MIINSENLKTVLWGCLMVVVLVGGGAWIWLMATSYVDIGSGCKIEISGSLASANKDAVSALLKEIKAEDKASYDLICSSLDHIREAHCPLFDESLKEDRIIWTTPGCYLRGTKTVYLVPLNSGYAASERETKEGLIRFAEQSRMYWTGK